MWGSRHTRLLRPKGQAPVWSSCQSLWLPGHLPPVPQVPKGQSTMRRSGLPPKPLRTPPSLDPTGCWGIWPHRRQIQETGLGKSEGWEYRDAPVLPPALCHLDEDMFPPWGGPPSPHDC